MSGFSQGAAGLQAAEDLRAKLTDLHHFMDMLSKAEGTAGEKSLALNEHLKELGLTWDQFPDTLKLLVNGLIGAGNAALMLGQGSDQAERSASKLMDPAGIERAARGILSLADRWASSTTRRAARCRAWSTSREASGPCSRG